MSGTELKFYVIEESEADYYGSHKYRFVSNYNGSRGSWTYNKSLAVQNGEEHKKIILALFFHDTSKQEE